MRPFQAQRILLPVPLLAAPPLTPFPAGFLSPNSGKQRWESSTSIFLRHPPSLLSLTPSVFSAFTARLVLLIKAPDPDFWGRREARLSRKNLKYLLVLRRYRKELSQPRLQCASSPISPFPRKSGASADLWDNIKKMLKGEKFPLSGFLWQGAVVWCCSAGPSLIKLLDSPSLTSPGC